FALFGEFGFDFTENLNITAGGRWFRTESEFELFQGALMQGDFPNSDTDLTFTDEVVRSAHTGFVPKVTLTYNVTPDKLIYFTYSEGFRRGGGNPVRRSSILAHTYD